jgi:hypothetical protein
MAAIPYALSIHHFINSVGADAGFAAIIGLAILILLFFSQARETANLRRRADAAEDEVHRLHAYVDQLALSRPQPAVAPVAAPPAAARIAPRPTAAPVASRTVNPAVVAAGALATIPAAPAGVGAPALSSATRLIPLADADEISIRALRPSTNGDSDSTELGPPVAAPAAPPPSTAAAGANGTGRVAPPPPPPVGPPIDGPAPRVALRPSGAPPGRPVGPPPRSTGEPPQRPRISRVAIAVLGALVVAAGVVVLLVVTGASGSSSSTTPNTVASQTTAAQHAGRRRRTPATTVVAPASVTVAVLNGTSTNNLAHDVMAKLNAAGYKPGSTGNSSDQQLTSTIVGFTQPAYRRDALAVAKSLNLGPASVQGVSQSDRAAACSATPSACPAQVVVTVGADLASNG